MGDTLVGFSLNIMVIGDTKFSRLERFISWVKVHLILSPLTFVLSSMGIWFDDNKKFTSFLLAVITANILIGAYTHSKKLRNFSWKILMVKTWEMCMMLIVTYAVLEMVILLAADNVLTDLFRITLQVSTMMYPISKVLKNVYIISGGEYPPEWIMKRVYNFEKDGDLRNFISSDGNNNHNQTTDE